MSNNLREYESLERGNGSMKIIIPLILLSITLLIGCGPDTSGIPYSSDSIIAYCVVCLIFMVFIMITVFIIYGVGICFKAIISKIINGVFKGERVDG